MGQNHLHVVPTSKDPAARAEEIVLDARQVGVVIARLMMRVPASESMEFGLAQCKAAVAALGDRYASEARASCRPSQREQHSTGR